MSKGHCAPQRMLSTDPLPQRRRNWPRPHSLPGEAASTCLCTVAQAAAGGAAAAAAASAAAAARLCTSHTSAPCTRRRCNCCLRTVSRRRNCNSHRLRSSSNFSRRSLSALGGPQRTPQRLQRVAAPAVVATPHVLRPKSYAPLRGRIAKNVCRFPSYAKLEGSRGRPLGGAASPPPAAAGAAGAREAGRHAAAAAE
jgi:hypothetical protein